MAAGSERISQDYGPSPVRVTTRQRIGRYELIYPIASGGMASVHVGRLSGMAGFQKLLAVKMIHPHLANNSSFVDMFLDEARLAARIHHPNVAEIYEIDDDDGRLFMVGELVIGQALSNVLERAKSLKSPLPPSLSAYIAAKVCRGLHAAHELKDDNGRRLNIVHRDVTPHNVLVSYDGFVKLIDFGIAWARDRLTETQNGALKGKLGFMSPEQFSGKNIDSRCDTFAVGVMLYLMVTGQHPFDGETDAVRMNRILSGFFTPPRRFVSDLDPTLEKIITKALSLNREGRFSTAELMGDALDAYVRKTGMPASPEAISETMHALFVDGLDEHKRRLVEYTDMVSNGQGSTAETRVLANPAPVEIETETFNRIDDTEPDEFTRKLSRKPIVILSAVIIVALVIGLYFLEGKAPAPETTEQPAIALPEQTEEPPRKEAERLPEKIKVTVDITPKDATIRLDGESLPPQTTEVWLPANGELHSMVIDHPKYQQKEERFEANSNQRLSISLKPIEKKMKKIKKGRQKRNSTQKKKKSELLGNPYRK